MIVGLFHPGSGLGNQLFRYVAVRALALDNGYDFMMLGDFKGAEFMPIDRGLDANIPFHIEEGGKLVADSQLPLWEEKGFYYNPEINYLEDNTIIDGSFEDERYFGHRLKEADEWLNMVPPNNVPDDVCVIGFRGGEYYTVPELGLPKEYFDRAIEVMKKINPNIRFEVHTDDPLLAKMFFPDYQIFNDVKINWRSTRYARYAIIANSSFYVLPRLLNGGTTIAPKYWNRYNTKKWDYPQNYYKSFIQI